MGTPYLGEIKIFSGNFAPKGWAECNGQFLPINLNQALFALLGTNYGGNGQTTFALPDLRGRVPVHFGGSFNLGQAGGQQAHTLTVSELPVHSHIAKASAQAPNAASPAGNYWSNPGAEIYAASPDAVMIPNSVGNQGGSQPHDNMSPYLVLTFIIALQGVFPAQN